MKSGTGTALLSLEGLSVGDAFGELFFSLPPTAHSRRELPPGPWRWTDDTHMAISIVEILMGHGRIEQDALALAFARRFRQEPFRGYGGGARSLLERISSGERWQDISPKLFGGGSYGNGAAMRAAPIGGFFAGDPERAAREAQLSALVTHAHIEGQAGAMAVAAAAAMAAAPNHPSGRPFIAEVMDFVPMSETRERMESSLDIPKEKLGGAIRMLGTGTKVSAQDTVPFCIWVAAFGLDEFEEALWRTAAGYGDSDTTCAIVGGIVSLSSPQIPREWIEAREPLPEELRSF